MIEMETHGGLELAQCLSLAENDLDGLCDYARVEIKRLGIISPDDKRYEEIAHLSDGILEFGDNQKFFRYIFHTVCHNSVFPTEFSKLHD